MEKHIFNLEVVNDKQKQIDAAIEASKKDNQKNLAEENLINKMKRKIGQIIRFVKLKSKKLPRVRRWMK